METFARLMHATVAFSRAIDSALGGLDRPLVVTLGHDDGMKLMAACASQFTVRDAKSSRLPDSTMMWAEIAGVRYEWPAEKARK